MPHVINALAGGMTVVPSLAGRNGQLRVDLGLNRVNKRLYPGGICYVAGDRGRFLALLDGWKDGAAIVRRIGGEQSTSTCLSMMFLCSRRLLVRPHCSGFLALPK